MFHANMLLCLQMATFAILTNNLTIRLLLWAKQEFFFFTLSLICDLCICNFMRCSFICHSRTNVIPEQKLQNDFSE